MSKTTSPIVNAAMSESATSSELRGCEASLHNEDEISMVRTESCGSLDDDDAIETVPSTCDACPCCNDICNDNSCHACDVKKRRLSFFDCSCLHPREPELRLFTKCQVKRHNHKESAWLVAGDKIYDATQYLDCHPAGEASILRKSGGVVDVTRDFEFHSPSARKLFRSLEIGRIKPCKCDYSTDGERTKGHKWWEFWNRFN